MKLIAGLGNPGAEYERTRHNAGFMVVDRLAARFGAGQMWRGQFQALAMTVDFEPGLRVILAKPTTYMNLSGRSVAEALGFYKLDPECDLLVVSDDLALSAGHIRGRASGSAGGHNGLASVEQLIGTSKYPRLRIGVDPKGLSNQSDYVLSRFTDDQWAKVDPILDTAADFCIAWAREGITPAMNTFNTKAKPGPPKDRPQDPSDTEPDRGPSGSE